MSLKTKSRIKIIITITIIYACFVIPYIVSKQHITIGGDVPRQWYPFYEEFYNLLDNFFINKSLPFYSWNMFLGNNFFASKSYYMLGDFYAYVGYLFKDIGYFYMMGILNWLKLIIASLSMYELLTRFKYSENIKLIGAFSYGLSSYALFFISQPIFLSFYSFLPLLFVGIEKYMVEKKPIMFIVTVSLLLLMNYYLFFSTSVFLLIYCVYRYLSIHKSSKGIFKIAFNMILYYLVGVCIVGVIIIPTVFFMLNNSRVGQSTTALIYSDLRVYMHLLVSIFAPGYAVHFHVGDIYDGNYKLVELCIWAGSLCAILLPQIFVIKKGRERKYVKYLYLTILLILFIPTLDSIMHGFSEPTFRWTLLIILMNVLSMCYVLNNINMIDKKLLKTTLVVYGVLLLISVPIILLLQNRITDIMIYKDQLFIYFVAIVFLSIFTLMLLKGKNNILNKLLILCISELSIFGFYFYNSVTGEWKESYDLVHSVTTVLEDNTGEINTYLNNIEPSNEQEYFRTYVDLDSVYWNYSRNTNLLYGLKGTMTYDTTFEPSYNEMKELTDNGNAWWMISVKDQYLLDLMNVKYAIVTDQNQLPNGNWRLLTDTFRKSLYVYRNDDYRPLGVSYNKVMSKDEYLNISDTKLFLDNVISDENNLEEIQQMLGNNKAILENIRYGDNYLLGTVDSEDDTFMVLTLPYDEGWNITVNGISVKTYMVNGGFTGFRVNSGHNDIAMYFTPKGFKQGVLVTILGFGLLIGIVIYNKQKKNNNEKR